jgi:hypothetical protein
MYKILYPSFWALLLVFSGCKNAQVLRCPNIAAAKAHYPTWARAARKKTHYEPAVKKEQPKATVANKKNIATATASTEIPAYQVKIPRMATGKLNEDDLNGVSDMFEKYSDNKVKLQRNSKGKLYLKAQKATDIFKLAKTLLAFKKNPAALPPGDSGRIALAGGIIGIVAIVLAFGPFVSYAAFLLGLIAIILGAVGLFSSRRGWAITGIVLGVLAIIIAGALGIGVYTVVLHI